MSGEVDGREKLEVLVAAVKNNPQLAPSVRRQALDVAENMEREDDPAVYAVALHITALCEVIDPAMDDMTGAIEYLMEATAVSVVASLPLEFVSCMRLLPAVFNRQQDLNREKIMRAAKEDEEEDVKSRVAKIGEDVLRQIMEMGEKSDGADLG